MRTRRFVAALVLVVAGAGALYARKNPRKNNENWMDQPFTTWSAKDVRTVLDNSAWSLVKAFRGQVTGEHGNLNPGATGTGENATLGVDVPNYEFKATLFSSLPVREAYVRLIQLENHYESLPAAKKQEFDQEFDGLLHADVSQEVVINLTYHVNDPIAMRDLNRWFNTQTVDTLKQNAYLYADPGQIILSKYLPPSETHGLGARFIFPRMQNGEPILSSAGRKLRFQLSYIPAIGQSMYIDFKPKDMGYQGQLSY